MIDPLDEALGLPPYETRAAADPLDEALGLPPMEIERRVPVVPEKETADADYEFARENLYRAVSKLEDAMDDLADVARISQHPRAYEVYANLTRTFVDANKDILNLRKAHQDTTGDRTRGPTTVNQTLMITSEEMLRAVKDTIRGRLVGKSTKVEVGISEED